MILDNNLPKPSVINYNKECVLFMQNNAPKLLLAKFDEKQCEKLFLGLIIEGVFVEETANGGFRLMNKDNTEVSCQDIDSAVNAVGAISFSKKGHEVVSRFIRGLNANDQTQHIEVYNAEQDDSKEHFLAWLHNALRKMQQALIVETNKFQLELSYIRRTQEVLQDNYIELERYLNNRFFSPELYFAFPQDNHNLVLNHDMAPGDWIIQRLPIDTCWLNTISFHVQNDEDFGSGYLLIELISQENNTLYDRWSIPFESIHKGWNNLRLSRMIARENDEILQLRLCWQPDTLKSPSLSLGHIHDIPQLWVSIPDVAANHRHPRRSLALRLFAVPPGMKSKPLVASISPKLILDDSTKFRFPGWMFTKAVEVSPKVPQCDFPLIHYIAEEGELEVHPLEGHTTIACLPYLCRKGTTSVESNIRTASSEGPIIEYAMAVLPPTASFREVFTKSKNSSFEGFSGWMELKPEVLGDITVCLAQPAATACHIYLATRLPSGQVSSHGWARFFNLVLSSQ